MDHDLIDGYLMELRRALRWRADLDDVCAEVEDHLRENAERLVATGVAPAEAQRRTLECFGDLGMVARSFAATPSGGLAVPTTFTRRSGRIAVGAGVRLAGGGARRTGSRRSRCSCRDGRCSGTSSSPR